MCCHKAHLSQRMSPQHTYFTLFTQNSLGNTGGTDCLSILPSHGLCLSFLTFWWTAAIFLLHKSFCIREVAQIPFTLEILQNPDCCVLLAKCLLITTVTATEYCSQQLLQFPTNDDNPSQNFSLHPSASLPALVTRFLTISAFNSCSTD